MTGLPVFLFGAVLFLELIIGPITPKEVAVYFPASVACIALGLALRAQKTALAPVTAVVVLGAFAFFLKLLLAIISTGPMGGAFFLYLTGLAVIPCLFAVLALSGLRGWCCLRKHRHSKL